MAITRWNCFLLVLSTPVLIGVLGILVENIFLVSNSGGKLLSNMSEVDLIAKNKVKSVATGELVPMESFWEKQPAIMIFFRRWGCAFCRLAAREISSVKKELDAHNVRLIGIGVEDIGKEDFVNGNFFAGELYIDEDKKCYKDLNYKRYGRFSLWPALLTKTSRDAIWASRALNVGGDLKGDYYQVGGTLVVSAGGDKVLFHHRQQSLADHANVNDVLKSLGIPPKEDTKAMDGGENTQCTTNGVNEPTPCQ